MGGNESKCVTSACVKDPPSSNRTLAIANLDNSEPTTPAHVFYLPAEIFQELLSFLDRAGLDHLYAGTALLNAHIIRGFDMRPPYRLLDNLYIREKGVHGFALSNIRYKNIALGWRENVVDGIRFPPSKSLTAWMPFLEAPWIRCRETTLDLPEGEQLLTAMVKAADSDSDSGSNDNDEPVASM